MAPPDHSNKRNNNNNNNATASTHGSGNNDNEYGDDDGKGVVQTDNAENIDHILDNMFVQRAPHFPPTTGLAAAARKSSSPAPVDVQKSHTAQQTKIGSSGDDVNSGGNDQQKGNSFGDIDISVAVGVSINKSSVDSDNGDHDFGRITLTESVV